MNFNSAKSLKRPLGKVWAIGGRVLLLLLASFIVTASVYAQVCIEDMAAGEVVCGPDESPVSPLSQVHYTYLPVVSK